MGGWNGARHGVADRLITCHGRAENSPHIEEVSLCSLSKSAEGNGQLSGEIPAFIFHFAVGPVLELFE